MTTLIFHRPFHDPENNIIRCTGNAGAYCRALRTRNYYYCCYLHALLRCNESDLCVCVCVLRVRNPNGREKRKSEDFFKIKKKEVEGGRSG